MEPFREVQDAYRQFAVEAADSPTFVDWALAVADDVDLQHWIQSLPPLKQQPNLVFAAARWHGVAAPGPAAGLREALLGDDGSIRATIMARATQTNEVGRMATLLPAIRQVAPGDQPVALLEVGPSAGLCLYPDRWSYAWQTDTELVRLGSGADGSPAHQELPCRVKGPAPLPTSAPVIAWRGGLDLNPLDVRNDDDMAWLENLVWPEQDERRQRLRHGIEVARTDPPQLVRGDLLTDLAPLVAQAAAHGTVIVQHSAVIAYVEPAQRLVFDEQMRDLVAEGACHWISNESPQVLPSITTTGPAPTKPTFILGIDGVSVARTHGHGRSMTWTA